MPRRRAADLSDAVTAGLDTLALRMPSRAIELCTSLCQTLGHERQRRDGEAKSLVEHSAHLHAQRVVEGHRTERRVAAGIVERRGGHGPTPALREPVSPTLATAP